MRIRWRNARFWKPFIAGGEKIIHRGGYTGGYAGDELEMLALILAESGREIDTDYFNNTVYLVNVFANAQILSSFTKDIYIYIYICIYYISDILVN